MEQDSDDRRRSSFTFWLVLAVVLLPVSYVLLSGPAVWLFQHGYSRTVLPMIFKPLIWLEQSRHGPRPAAWLVLVVVEMNTPARGLRHF